MMRARGAPSPTTSSPTVSSAASDGLPGFTSSTSPSCSITGTCVAAEHDDIDGTPEHLRPVGASTRVGQRERDSDWGAVRIDDDRSVVETPGDRRGSSVLRVARTGATRSSRSSSTASVERSPQATTRSTPASASRCGPARRANRTSCRGCQTRGRCASAQCLHATVCSPGPVVPRPVSKRCGAGRSNMCSIPRLWGSTTRRCRGPSWSAGSPTGPTAVHRARRRGNAGGDSPAWSRKRQPYEPPPSLERRRRRGALRRAALPLQLLLPRRRLAPRGAGRGGGPPRARGAGRSPTTTASTAWSASPRRPRERRAAHGLRRRAVPSG